MIDARQYAIGKYKPYDFETIVVSTSSIGLTASKIQITPGTPEPKRIFVSIENARIRFRFDGVNPTSSVGHILVPSQTFIFEGYFQLKNLQMIRADNSDATVQVTYLY